MTFIGGNEKGEVTHVGSMNEELFKAQFIAAFCATWCANKYDDACIRGEADRLEKPPMDDAFYLASCAWQEWIQIRNQQ